MCNRPLESYPVTQPDNSRIVRLHNRTTKALSGYITGQLKPCPDAQPDNSSATRLRNRTNPAPPGYATGQLQRYPVAQSDNSSATRLRAGQSRCATGWHFPRVCASGSLICPVVQPWLHNGQLKHCPVAQPDNSSATRLRNRTMMQWSIEAE